MGYYESPPMIQPGKGSEIVSASIVDAASALAKGLLARGERKRKEEKERRLTVQDLQNRKNETDLYYNDKLSDWAQKEPKVNDAVDKKIYGIVQGKITLAADSRIALLNETDPEKRQEYLKNIRNADSVLTNAAAFAKRMAEQTATWRLDTKGVKVGTVGGHVINGKDDKEILDNTAFLETLGGMNALYKDTNIDVSEDSNGDGFVLKTSGKYVNGDTFDVSINSRDYLKADAEAGDGILIPVEGLDTFHTQAKENIVDKKGNIYDGYLLQTHETFDLNSKGTSGGIGRDIYQIKDGRRLQTDAIKAKISETSKVTATGILSADGPSRIRTMLNYTLGQGVGFYDSNFKDKNPEEQKELLTNILTEKAFSEMTRSLETSKDKNGQTIYWNPSSTIDIKNKPSAASLKGSGGGSGGGFGSGDATNYKSEYYDNIIRGYVTPKNEKILPGQINYRTRASLVEHLNKLSATQTRFITKEDLIKEYKKQPYVAGKYETGKTIEEAYKEGDIKEDPAVTVEKTWGKGEVFSKKEGGTYAPIKGYDLTKAKDRVKLTLDQTVEAGERKLLQEKLKDASLNDWLKANPIRRGESEEAYIKRARKSYQK